MSGKAGDKARDEGGTIQRSSRLAKTIVSIVHPHIEEINTADNGGETAAGDCQ